MDEPHHVTRIALHTAVFILLTIALVFYAVKSFEEVQLVAVDTSKLTASIGLLSGEQPAPDQKTEQIQISSDQVSRSAVFARAHPDGHIVVGWKLADDVVPPKSYTVYRDNTLVGITTRTSYTDYDIVPGTQYTYTIGLVGVGEEQLLSASAIAIAYLQHTEQNDTEQNDSTESELMSE